MTPSKHANALCFTPRTPWGTRVPRRALQNHMQSSENKILGAVKKGAQWVGDHVFVGAEGEKNPGEKPSFGFGVGVRVGKGEPSTGEDSHGENSDWQNERLHINEAATNKGSEHHEQEAKPKTSTNHFDTLPDNIKANYYKSLEKFRQQQKNQKTPSAQPAAPPPVQPPKNPTKLPTSRMG